MPVLRSIPNPQSIRVVNLLTWKYGDPAFLIAQQLGLTPGETAYTTMGGQSPQSLVNATAAEIQAGDARHRDPRRRRSAAHARACPQGGASLNWPTAPEGQVPRIIGDDLVLNHPVGARARRDDAGADLPDVRDRDPRPQPD